MIEIKEKVGWRMVEPDAFCALALGALDLFRLPFELAPDRFEFLAKPRARHPLRQPEAPLGFPVQQSRSRRRQTALARSWRTNTTLP